MARFAFWVAAYGAALRLVSLTPGGVPGILSFLFWITFIPCVFYYLYRLGAFVKPRLLWRLRRRLITTYVFIAVVPILLIVLLVGIRDFIVSGQIVSFFVAAKLQEHAEELRQLNRVMARMTEEKNDRSPEALLDRLERSCVNQLSLHAGSYPELAITVRLGSLSRAFRLDGSSLKEPVTVPAWLDREEFAGIVNDRDRIVLRAVGRTRTALGDLTLILSQPFTPELLDIVSENLGPVIVIPPRPRNQERVLPPSGSGARLITPESEYADAWAIRSKTTPVPKSAGFWDFPVVGASTLDPVVWEGGNEQRVAEPVLVSVTSRVFTLNSQILAALGRFSRVYLAAFLVVGSIFLMIELFALVVGVRLTRSITTTVDKLHDATERVKAGEFSHRINLPARDQLSALGEAFDGMTASVERLLRESREKTRLEGELEIARQVQNQLFPQTVPEIPGLRVYGACKPARVVSGDYYDFFRLGENHLGIVLGDISGKGISAALLMASIQSALHAQFYTGHSPADLPHFVPLSPPDVVGRLNRQLFASTPREKYVTFFYAVYDGETRKLAYTNAGHLPPVLFRRGQIERLEAGGTVVGLFPTINYEQAEIQLEPGDLLLAFTDGMTEPENSFGEEFGEPRLLEVARRALSSPPETLVGEIFRSVTDWTGSPELQDDMTVLVARAFA